MKNSYSLNLGLVLAAVSIVIFLIGVLIDGGMIFGISMFVIAIAITAILNINTLKKRRSNQNGFLSFKEGFITSFLGLIISGIIVVVFTYVYANFIDTGYVDHTVEKTLESSAKWMQGNMSEDELQTNLQEMETRTREGFTLVGMLKGFVYYYLIFYLILALIFAAVTKKNPETDTIDGNI